MGCGHADGDDPGHGPRGRAHPLRRSRGGRPARNRPGRRGIRRLPRQTRPGPPERALRQAVHTARTPDPVPSSASGPYLLPLRDDAEKALGLFFETRLRLTAAPADPEARRALEDSLFTLCVLMGQPCAPEALHEAVQYTES